MASPNNIISHNGVNDDFVIVADPRIPRITLNVELTIIRRSEVVFPARIIGLASSSSACLLRRQERTYAQDEYIRQPDGTRIRR